MLQVSKKMDSIFFFFFLKGKLSHKTFKLILSIQRKIYKRKCAQNNNYFLLFVNLQIIFNLIYNKQHHLPKKKKKVWFHLIFYEILKWAFNHWESEKNALDIKYFKNISNGRQRKKTHVIIFIFFYKNVHIKIGG